MIMKVGSVQHGILPKFDSSRTPAPEAKQDSQGGTRSAASARREERPDSRNIFRNEVEEAVTQLNETMRAYYTELRFEVHEKSGEIMVKVLNERDGTVIREIPPEKILDMVAYFKKVLGIIVDELI